MGSDSNLGVIKKRQETEQYIEVMEVLEVIVGNQYQVGRGVTNSQSSVISKKKKEGGDKYV